jgi:hypothetical protein
VVEAQAQTRHPSRLTPTPLAHALSYTVLLTNFTAAANACRLSKYSGCPGERTPSSPTNPAAVMEVSVAPRVGAPFTFTVGYRVSGE